MDEKCSDQLDGDLHHRGHDWSLGKVLHGACSRDRTVGDPTLKINRPDEITGCQHCQINKKSFCVTWANSCLRWTMLV